jgi:eukaryotic-like serine/threonine-protein kinase
MAATPQFVGQILGHYRILEQIGAGGMGVVYRAHDQQLERDVAIKVLPAGTLADEAARRSFRKEALALAKLNHPSIETIHEFGSEEGVDFLVTEYIPGVTLDAKLAGGVMPEREVLRLGIHLAEGLEAAHEQNIVHRDLKPGNLRLSRSGRLKILDFGLARFVAPAHETAATVSLTESQQFTGTLPYMAPEQLLAKPTDARSDIWATGAVLYEMTTSHRPFEEKVPAALIAEILHKAPASPRTWNPRLSSKLEAVILKCLQKDPEQRYQSARDLRTDLERLSTGLTPLAVRPTLPWALAAGVLLLVAATAISSWYLLRRRAAPSASPVASVHPRLSVAVLGFKNLSGKADTAWLSTALSEMLTTELAAGENLRTVPGETVAQMKASLALPDADSFGKETLTRIRQNLQSDDVVLGSYIPLGGGLIRVDLRLQDTVAGETLASISEKGSEQQLDELANRAGAELRAKLGLGGLSAGEAAAVRASLPTNSDAARLYAEGLAKLRLADYLGARDLLQKALAVEPQYALGHSALSAAWLGLGYQDKARDEAKIAVDTSGALSSEQRLWVEGHYRETTREFDKAIEIYRKLRSGAPDDIEYGLRLASVQTSAGKANDSLATLQELRNLPSPIKDDPRIDLAEATAAESVSDFQRENTLALHAGGTATAQGARLLVARARLTQCSALDYLHDLKNAMSACEEAKTIYASAGNPQGVATTLLNMGNVFADRGELDRANQVYEESLKISRQLGNQGSTASALNNIAANLNEQGDFTGATKMFREALAIKREVGAKSETARTLYNLGNVFLAQGALSDAEKMYDESLQISQEIGDKEGMANAELNSAELFRKKGDLARAQSRYDEARAAYDQTQDKAGVAYALVGTAGLLAVKGDLSGAQKAYEQALEISRSADDKHEVGFALSGLGDVSLIKGDTADAKKLYDEALSLRKELGEKANAAEVQVGLAAVALEEGRPSEVQDMIRGAEDEFRKERLKDDEILGDSILADALLTSGNVTEARRQADAMEPLAAKSQSRELRLRAGVIAARVHAASGGRSEITGSMQRLRLVAAEATRRGFVQEDFESRLALGQIEMKSGQVTAGRNRLAALEKEASENGFLLIARKAQRSAGN